MNKKSWVICAGFFALGLIIGLSRPAIAEGAEVALITLGCLTLALFVHFAFQKDAKFEAPLLGLLTLGFSLLAVAAFNPSSLTIGNMQMVRKTAREAAAEAKYARDLATEAMAFAIWNTGDYRNTPKATRKVSEDAVREILQSVHGENADKFIHALQHKGVLWTPKSELKKIPKDFKPDEFSSSLLINLPQWTNY